MNQTSAFPWPRGAAAGARPADTSPRPARPGTTPGRQRGPGRARQSRSPPCRCRDAPGGLAHIQRAPQLCPSCSRAGAAPAALTVRAAPSSPAAPAPPAARARRARPRRAGPIGPPARTSAGPRCEWAARSHSGQGTAQPQPSEGHAPPRPAAVGPLCPGSSACLQRCVCPQSRACLTAARQASRILLLCATPIQAGILPSLQASLPSVLGQAVSRLPWQPCHADTQRSSGLPLQIPLVNCPCKFPL